MTSIKAQGVLRIILYLIQTISSKNGFSAFLTCLRKLADFDEGQESLPIELQKIFLTENYLGLTQSS
jgi:hypothetical protein